MVFLLKETRYGSKIDIKVLICTPFIPKFTSKLYYKLKIFDFLIIVDLDTQNLLVNSAEVIDLFDVNDHIPNVPTQRPIVRRPTPTTRLNVPLNNQNSEFSAVFPGRFMGPLGGLVGFTVFPQ